MEIKDIINCFKSESGFIEDIDNIVEFLKNSIPNITTEKINEILILIFDYNKELNKCLEKENQEFEKLIQNRKTIIGQQVNSTKIIQPMELHDIVEEQLDISYYKKQIDNCNDLSEIESLLPKRNVENFSELINYILLSLLQEETEFRQMLYESSKILEEDFEILEYINGIKRKFEIVKNYRDFNPKTSEVTEITKNSLIFLTTKYGNVCALSDIKNINFEYYEGLLKLLESIIDGTFKNVKSFNIQRTGTLISEVKGFQQRICFTKLENDVYAILNIFVKKSDNDLSYRNNLIVRDSLYRSKLEGIRSQLNSLNRQSFLDDNNLITEEIIRVLKSGTKVKRLSDNHE